MIRLLDWNLVVPNLNLGVNEPRGQEILSDDVYGFELRLRVSTKNEEGSMRVKMGRRVGRHAAMM